MCPRTGGGVTIRPGGLVERLCVSGSRYFVLLLLLVGLSQGSWTKMTSDPVRWGSDLTKEVQNKKHFSGTA